MLRFGISLIPSPVGGRDPVRDAAHAEELGFDLVTVWDHLHGEHPAVETWTLLTWIAAKTSRISVAPVVLGLPYRPPAVTAKMAESLDRLSGGRLILGLGGGGSDTEFRAFGLPVRERGDKVDALEESIRVIRGLWENEQFSFDGEHFRLERARIEPRPERRIPIWLGTYGKRALGVTGRLADGWIPSLPYAPPQAAAEKWDRLRRAAEDAGRDPESVVWAYNVSVKVGERRELPNTITGEPEEVVERVGEILKLGVRFPVFWPRGGADQREALAGEVIPALWERFG